MGYLFLSISLLAGATKGFCGKKTSGYAANSTSAVLINLIRMSMCVLFSAILMLLMGDIKSLTLDPKVISVSAISGVSTSLFVVTWLLSVRKNAYMMVDVFLMLGTIVPMSMGFFIFSERILIRQWIGFVILVLAAIIMCSYSNSIKVKLTPSAFVLLAICGLANGITDFSQKWFVKSLPSTPVSVFNLYTYIFAAITLVVCYVFFSSKEKVKFEEKSKSSTKLIYLLIAIMSISLIACSYFKTLAAAYLDSAQLYPLNQGVALTLSTLMAAIFFKEKLNLKCVVGIVLSFIGLLIMNL